MQVNTYHCEVDDKVEQRLANYNPLDRCSLVLVFVNTVLLGDSDAHSFTRYLWLLSHHIGRAE